MSDASMPVWERRFRAPTVTFPAWSPHAPERLAYTSTESGTYQAHVLHLASGEERRVTDDPVGVTDAAPTADGRAVVWFHDETGDESGRYLVAPFDGGEAVPLLPGVPDGWGGGVALGLHTVVASISTNDGFAVYAKDGGSGPREIARSAVTLHLGGAERGGFNVAALSADEDLLCLEHGEHGDGVRRALRVVDPRSGDVVADLWDGAGRGLTARAWSPIPGDRRLAITHEREGEQRPAIWDLATGERRGLLVEAEGPVEALGWWPDGSALLLLNLYEGRDRLLRLDLTSGAIESIPHPDGSICGALVRPDGRVWYRIASGAREPRVCSQDGVEVLSARGPRAPEGTAYRSWHFSNPQGQRVHGWIVEPPGEPPHPVVMYIHGGPTWLSMDDWRPDIQALVDAGFVVALVNYRGSTGYGVEWRDALVGNIGFPESEDILAGLEELIEAGVADPHRAVIAGWSWGGYLTLLGLGLHPDRYAAGVAGVPVGDYAACYEDLSPPLQEYDRYLLGAAPADVPDLVRERSPITYVDRVRSPVLALIAENDTRCPPRQAHAYVEALRSRGGDVEVYSYGTGHSSFVIDEEVRQTRAMLDFLARHVGG